MDGKGGLDLRASREAEKGGQEGRMRKEDGNGGQKGRMGREDGKGSRTGGWKGRTKREAWCTGWTYTPVLGSMPGLSFFTIFFLVWFWFCPL